MYINLNGANLCEGLDLHENKPWYKHIKLSANQKMHTVSTVLNTHADTHNIYTHY